MPEGGQVVKKLFIRDVTEPDEFTNQWCESGAYAFDMGTFLVYDFVFVKSNLYFLTYHHDGMRLEHATFNKDFSIGGGWTEATLFGQFGSVAGWFRSHGSAAR